MQFIDIFRKNTGWCPNHPASATPAARVNPGIYLVAAVCLLAIAVALPMVPAARPDNVAVWAFRFDDSGVRHFVARLPAAEDVSGKISFPGGPAAQSLPAGKYWLVIEHPDRDGNFQLGTDGVNVKIQSPDSPGDGRMIFRISGPGSLQQEDAYEALMAAYGGMYETGSTTGTSVNGEVSQQEYFVKQ